MYLKHTYELGHRDSGGLHNFRDPKLTPPHTLPSVGTRRPGINWISVFPSSEHQVLPSCQGLRDQARSPELECSPAKQIPAGSFGQRESSPLLPSIPKSRGSGDNLTFLIPSQGRQRANAESTPTAQSQAQKEKFHRDRQAESQTSLKFRPPG